MTTIHTPHGGGFQRVRSVLAARLDVIAILGYFVFLGVMAAIWGVHVS